MDKQQIAALIFFLIISLVMLYGFLHPEKALGFLKKVYGIFGIKLDFTERGEKIVKGILITLFLIFFTSSIALILF